MPLKAGIPVAELVEHGAQGEQIGARYPSLRREPVRGTCRAGCPALQCGELTYSSAAGKDGASAEFGARRRKSAAGCRKFRQAEIENFDESAFRDEDVRGLDIAVDNSLGVRRFQCVGDLEGNANDLIRGHGFALHHHAQRLPFQQLHAYVVPALVFANFVDRADVRMIQGRSGPRFALEPLKVGRIGCKIFGQQLQRDFAAQFRVPGAVHHSHPAGTKLVQKLIMRKHLAHAADPHLRVF